MEVAYPRLSFDLRRDCFVVWLRWVSLERPASPDAPASQGIRVELKLNRHTVLGPTILYRRDLEAPVYLRANRLRTVEILEAARGSLDLQLIIHGSIANAPFAALYHLRDYAGEAIDTAAIPATPLLQLQPSTPGDRWHVAGQANLRVALAIEGEAPHRLPVLN
ncbi:MAG: hypothetical protein R3A79_10685 [Nannocystaceae bacterium]